jgi:8-oxo-dGTP pyrophosphatase MutT (NUDIX family)
VEFLCLRRTPGRTLGGVWQPVTGKRRPGERAVRAAARELAEETGLTPLKFWALETVAVYFDAAADRVRLLPLFAAEVGPRDRVRLSGEHDAFRFLPARKAGALYLWEAQRSGLAAVAREILARPALAKALEVPFAPAGPRISSRSPISSRAIRRRVTAG